MVETEIPLGEAVAGEDPEGCGEPLGETTGEEDADGAVEEAGKTLLGPTGVEVFFVSVSDSVTGQIVVETAIVLVITLVESAGQSVTVAAQLVTVIKLVL